MRPWPLLTDQMKRLTVDEMRSILPRLDELRPVVDFVLESAERDPERTWASSGDLETIGGRLVPSPELLAAAESLAEREHRHLRDLYGTVAAALESLRARDGSGAARAFLEAAALEEERMRPDRAASYAQSAYLASRDERDQSAAALSLRRWARASWHSGDLAQASRRYAEAYDVALALRDGHGAAESAVGAGNVLEQQGRWRAAESWYRRALQALDATEAPGPARWHAHLCMHIALRSRGEVSASLASLERAGQVAEALSDGSASVFLENARGQLAMAAGDFPAALDHFRSALGATSNLTASITLRLNLAEALLAHGRLLEAGDAARAAEGEALRARAPGRLVEVYRMLGRIASASGSNDSLVFFERALELADELTVPELEKAVTLQAYAQAEAERGESEIAEELEAAALRLYASLGIDHPRHRWVDVFGPAEDADRALDSANGSETHE